ncbi:putative DMT superfamily transporter inner membrane protein [Anaerobiospirillum thomasii]|uniref:DMT family transporter n=1 Tax=Anaerobiospirillum thomasii TaxID=179995 RepID=UPI000D88C6CD|nr:DMT family transporter [Anaerobiospirillum thomasii]SPT68124.1 putative DMT superfamily transporter inner membrane protein [Anaerobiospirillum thomasii]
MFQLRQSFLLFLTASIWGSGFVAQSVGMDHVTPFTFTFFRTLIGALFLLPFIALIKALYKNKVKEKSYTTKDLLIGSASCGLFLIMGESFQQYGLVTTDAGKTGFITSMYIIFVPLISITVGKKINRFIWIGVILAVIGMYLLCIKQDFTIERGDLLILCCAVAFAFHIMVIDHFVKTIDGVMLACGQFFMASFMGLILMLIFDFNTLSYDSLMAAAPAMLYAGIMSNGIAYTLQVVGQRGINPAVATLILSLESVMAVIFGITFLNESLDTRELIGCVLMFLAVIIAQYPFKK